MKSLLIKQDLSLVIEGKLKNPTSMTDADSDKLDEKAMATIFLALSDDVLYNVTNEPTTKQVWDKLTSIYAMASAVNKVLIMKKLDKLKMREGEAMTNHLNEFNTLINQENLVGMTQDNENKVVLLLCSLPNRWDGLVIVVSTSASSTKKLVFDEVSATLLSKDLRRKNDEPSSGNTLTMVSTKNRGRSQYRDRNNYNQRSQSGRRSQSRRQNGCYFCGKAGHVKKDCRKYKKTQEKVLDRQANKVHDKDDGILVLATMNTKFDS